MTTLLDHWDRRYTDRVRLLVEILPVLAQEPHFALKGGTAINLFEHDLPRLSVDIDLAWLPVHDYAEDAQLITEALKRLADALRARPLQLQVHLSQAHGAGVTRLVASRGRARVQIETTPVMRGTVHLARNMVVRPKVFVVPVLAVENGCDVLRFPFASAIRFLAFGMAPEGEHFWRRFA